MLAMISSEVHSSHSKAALLPCSALDELLSLSLSEKSLASRFAVLQEGEKKKRRKRESPEEENVLNIQLAVFIDRFFTSTEVAKRRHS